MPKAFLQRPDAAFDDRDAAILRNRAETLTNATAMTPALEMSAGELRALIGEQMPWRFAEFANHASKELADLA